MAKIIDIVGNKYGRLTVIERAESHNGHIKWKCKCDCGNVVDVDSYKLRHGNVKSCGCFNKEVARNRRTTHGLSKTHLYETFMRMKARCYQKNSDNYKYYGGRGIKICDEWLNDFTSFYNWSIQNGYSIGLTIDRIDVDGNYEPSNCRWSTCKEQSNNRRNNRKIHIGIECKTFQEWCDFFGVSRYKMKYYTNKGFGILESVEIIKRKENEKWQRVLV